MADPKSTGSGPGVANAPATTAAPPLDPTLTAKSPGLASRPARASTVPVLTALEDIALNVEKTFSAVRPVIGILQKLLETKGDPAAITGMRLPTPDRLNPQEAPTPPPPRKPPLIPPGQESDDDDDKDDDTDEGQGVDDVVNLNHWRSPIEKAIDAEVSRLHLLDAILAGVDASLDPEEGHLAIHRLDPGDPQLVLAVCRRLVWKSIENFDDVRISPLLRKERAAVAARSANLARFKDVPEFRTRLTARIESRRRSMKISLKELAESVGVSTEDLFSWLLGELPFDDMPVEKLAESLDVSFDDLMGALLNPTPPKEVSTQAAH